jgi:hypothetical protein
MNGHRLAPCEDKHKRHRRHNDDLGWPIYRDGKRKALIGGKAKNQGF